MGVLATHHESPDHSVDKREAYAKAHSSTPFDGIIYEARDKGILFTTKAPILKIHDQHNSKKDIILKLEKYVLVTADEDKHNDAFRLNIKFIVPEKTVT